MSEGVSAEVVESITDLDEPEYERTLSKVLAERLNIDANKRTFPTADSPTDEC